MKKLLVVLVAAAASLFGAALHAGEYPIRPITLVAVFGPGSASDTICRVIADPLGAALKQPVIVENRPGADGALAAQYVQHATPDGYTLLMGTNSPLSAAPFLLKDVSYDPVRDFTPVTRVGSFTLMLVVNPGIPAKSIKELIAYAKANPGKLSIAFDNTAGAAAFGAKLFNKRTGMGLVEVPYRSSGQMIQDVSSGLDQVMMSSIVAANPGVQAGKVRRLAVTSARRFPGLPDLPALQESVPGVVMNGLFAIVAPAGTPADVIARLNREIGRYLEQPEIQQRLIVLGLATDGSGTPESAGLAIRTEQEQWLAVAAELKVEPQ